MKSLDLFHGETSLNRSQIYARLPRDEAAAYAGAAAGAAEGAAAADLALAGSIVGPFCRHSRTLTSTIAFHDCGPGESLLARAVLPDPCFWSPDVPSLYRVTIELRRKSTGETLARDTREFGVRMFGVQGRNLIWESARWVLRGVYDRSLVAGASPDDWRQSLTARLAFDPSDAVCTTASQEGVLLIADTAASDMQNLRRLARWSAVAMAILPADARPAEPPRQIAPNLVIGADLGAAVGAAEGHACPEWAEFVVCDFGAPLVAAAAAFARPIVVRRRLATPVATLAEARAACDALQRDTAAFGNFAGYLV